MQNDRLGIPTGKPKYDREMDLFIILSEHLRFFQKYENISLFVGTLIPLF